VRKLADEAKAALGGYYREFTFGITKNRRSVWTIPNKPYAGAHCAAFPPELARMCILAGSRPGDTVLDCFNGSGTSAQIAVETNRSYIGVELNPEYIALTRERLTTLEPESEPEPNESFEPLFHFDDVPSFAA
jgi:site-specific DNA-methyltransferase (cytosine-N4-specific)